MANEVRVFILTSTELKVEMHKKKKIDNLEWEWEWTNKQMILKLFFDLSWLGMAWWMKQAERAQVL